MTLQVLFLYNDGKAHQRTLPPDAMLNHKLKILRLELNG